MIEVNGLKLDKEVVNKMLVSDVRQLNYIDEDKTLVVHQRELCCTDMNGTIRLAKQIDPEVRRIVTYSGKKSDINYFLDEVTNSWKYKDTRWLHNGGAPA